MSNFDTDRLLYKKTNIFIDNIINKIHTISNIKKNTKYIVISDKLLLDNRSFFQKKISNLLIDNDENLYNFIRINIDHCINMSQIIISNINDIKHTNIYSKHYKYNNLLDNKQPLEFKLCILFKLTKELSNTLSGITNLKISKNYKILLWDIKKVISIYTLNTLNVLLKHYHILTDNTEIDYGALLEIQNNIIYYVKE